ncbi:MAG: 4Fe-4S dicluster domain-containing protein [Fibrobacteraceae bacterium]
MRNSKERLQRYILESQTRPMNGASRGLKILAFMYKLIGRKTIAHSLVCSGRCDGCSACVRACPNKAISLKGSAPVRNRHCRGCLLCVYACPKRAFEIPVLALVGACVLLFLPFDDWIIRLFSLNIPKDYHSAKYAISSLVLWGIGYAIALFIFEALVMLLSRTALFKRLGEIPWVHRLREKINPVRVFPAILPPSANAARIREKRNS